MKRFSVLLITLMMIASNCFAMTFSQPIKLGRFYTQIQRSSGFHAEGASSNKGTRYDKVAKYIKNYGWDKGLATFGEGIDALYIYYDYENDKMPRGTRFGGKDISNTVGIGVWHDGTIMQIKGSNNMTFYSVRFSYCTSHLHIIGKNKDGKWVEYIDSKKLSDKYFGGKDSYKEDGGVIYDVPTCVGDKIIVTYRRWYWKGTSEPEGEFRFKWDDKAQWFGVEQIIY